MVQSKFDFDIRCKIYSFKSFKWLLHVDDISDFVYFLYAYAGPNNNKTRYGAHRLPTLMICLFVPSVITNRTLFHLEF
jgi:hypothetical protein